MKIKLLAVGALTLPVMAFAPLVAAAATPSTTTPSTTPSSATKTSTDDTEKADFDKLVDLEGKKQTQVDRIKGRITELKVKLTTAEQAKLKIKCVGAQATVKTLNTRIDNGITARSKAYDELLKHLDDLITKLKDANLDSATLTTQRTELKAKIETFKTDLAKYKVALTDTQSLGCQADPTGFKASLEAARAARAVVATDAVAIRSYVTDTIKPSLKALHDQLDATKSANTDDTTTGGTQ